MDHHEFGLRFRSENEPEGYGTILIACTVPDNHVVGAIRRTVSQTLAQHAVVFDGVIYYGRQEAPNRP